MLHNLVGYMGHLRDIANAIVQASKEGSCAELIQNEIKVNFLTIFILKSISTKTICCRTELVILFFFIFIY